MMRWCFLAAGSVSIAGALQVFPAAGWRHAGTFSRSCEPAAQAADWMSSEPSKQFPTTAEQWDDSSFSRSEEPSLAPEPVRATKPIECVIVGRVSGPYKRRNGYHCEVMVQHASLADSVHRLWFGHEVLQDVAKLHGRQEHDIEVTTFAETVVRFLQEQGVALSDADWGLDDDTVPFSVGHLPLRTLFEYYPQLPEYLAKELLSGVTDEEVRARMAPSEPYDPEENIGRITDNRRAHDDEGDDMPFPCLGAL